MTASSTRVLTAVLLMAGLAHAEAPPNTAPAAASMLGTQDIFPSQRVLRPAPALPAAAAIATVPATPAPFPYRLTGEWRDGNQHMVIMDGLGETLVLCRVCSIEGAIRPGDHFGRGYQLQSLSAHEIVLLGADKKEQTLMLHMP